MKELLLGDYLQLEVKPNGDLIIYADDEQERTRAIVVLSPEQMERLTKWLNAATS